MEQQVPNEILVGIYEKIGTLQADVAATKTATEANALRLDGLAEKIDDLDKDVKTLSTKEARNAIKWGILTFAATTLLVTGMNYAIGEERPQLRAIPPSFKELGQAELVIRDGPWGEK